MYTMKVSCDLVKSNLEFPTLRRTGAAADIDQMADDADPLIYEIMLYRDIKIA